MTVLESYSSVLNLGPDEIRQMDKGGNWGGLSKPVKRDVVVYKSVSMCVYVCVS